MNISNSKYLIFLLLAVLSTFITVAQNEDYKIETLMNEYNITQNTINSVYVDSLGFLWFGKVDGLYKYNGYDFEIFTTNFNSKTGLSNSYVVDIEDFNDSYAIGTMNGINFLHKRSQTFTHIFPSDLNYNLSNSVVSLHVLDRTRILASLDNGICKRN